MSLPDFNVLYCTLYKYNIESTLAEAAEAAAKAAAPPGVKRGQKGKLKKVREKYRDQDDEERNLRMQILQVRGKPADSSLMSN